MGRQGLIIGLGLTFWDLGFDSPGTDDGTADDDGEEPGAYGDGGRCLFFNARWRRRSRASGSGLRGRRLSVRLE